MEISLLELIDKMTILKLKIEKVGDPQLRTELEEYEKAIEELKKRGAQIEQEWFDKLYEINKEIWDLQSKINNARKQGSLKEIGGGYIELAISNKKRITVKNEIASKTGRGFKDIAMNT